MSTVLYEKSGHVVTMTLNRPEALNAINREMAARLAECWRLFREDADARVAIITGAGRWPSEGRWSPAGEQPTS